jgi:hypothetical protein
MGKNLNTNKNQFKESEQDSLDHFKVLLQAYKKFKQIAKLESELSVNQMRNPAKLNKDDLDKIKLLESRLGCNLVAFENNSNEYRKSEILSGIHLLLDDYLKLFNPDINKENVITFSPSKAKSIESSEFNGFFE